MRTMHPGTKAVAYDVGQSMLGVRWPAGTELVLSYQDLVRIALQPDLAGPWLAELLKNYSP